MNQQPKYRITMRRTITDPFERRRRLAQLYAIFERGNQKADGSAILVDGESSAVETRSDSPTRLTHCATKLDGEQVQTASGTNEETPDEQPT